MQNEQMSYLITLTGLCTGEVVACATRQEKETEGVQIGKVISGW